MKLSENVLADLLLVFFHVLWHCCKQIQSSDFDQKEMRMTKLASCCCITSVAAVPCFYFGI